MVRVFDYSRRSLIAALHGLTAGCSLLAAYLLRFEFCIPASETMLLLPALPLAIAAKVIILHLAGCGRGGWRYISAVDLTRLLIGNVIASAFYAAAGYAAMGESFPRSVYVIDLLVCFLLTAAARVSVRLYHDGLLNPVPRKAGKHVLLYGAGAAGMSLMREIRSNPSLGYRVLGFLDDDNHKLGVNVMGATVLGPGRQAARIVEKFQRRGSQVDEIVIAMPSANGRQMVEALANCRAAGVACKTVPSVGGLLTGKILTSQIRDVSVVDLLGRDPVHLDETVIRQSIQGRVVMVTGAGGSIGSELCRQVSSYQPSRLILFERAESDLFRIHMDLRNQFPDVSLVPQIGDIREWQIVDDVIAQYGVDSIFHAAAYKHVPMMEAHMLEAVKNNIVGTRNVVEAALRNGVSSFLMISSDKAVNPTNIMGLSKRIAELIVSSMLRPEEGQGTRFISVRFGNVLGSNGSVVPIFRDQIAAGGPVTVTHPDMTRYFMTIPEAVQLVLQASTMGKGSEIFVLDMGEPVRVVDLARNMIRLSGHEPDLDIEIRFTGLRPGEKLFEELILTGEDILPTYHEKIRIFCGRQREPEFMTSWLDQLDVLIAIHDEAAVLRHLHQIVPEYEPGEKWQEMLHHNGTARVVTV
jgi:FlaA1/EpsC-like NDP-sugar epimerase